MKITDIIVVFLVIAFVAVSLSEAGRKLRDPKRKILKKKKNGKCKPHILAEYELSFEGVWSTATYPRMYPKYRPPAQWSKLIGRSHSDLYTMWAEGSVSSPAVQSFAESSDTRGFDTEAQAYGGIRDTFTAAPIRGGLGKTVTNFITDGRHTKVSFMVKLIPSPDWFVGISSFDLCQRKRWKSHIELDLYPLDAGTDKGLTFTSPNWQAEPREKIYKLSPTIPNHTASAFHYSNITSLPPIAKVHLTKISEYRRNGKKLPPLKQERNLIIFEDNPSHRNVEEIIPKLERIIDRVVDESKHASMNEILTPRAEPLTGSVPECIVSEWTTWTPCSKTCGFGRQERRRKIIERSTKGLYCPVLREDRTCGTMTTCNWESFQFLKQGAYLEHFEMYARYEKRSCEPSSDAASAG